MATVPYAERDELPAVPPLTTDDLAWRPDFSPEEQRSWLERARASLVGIRGRPLLMPPAPREAAALNRVRLEALRSLEGQAAAVREATALARRLLERVDLSLLQAARLAASALTAAGTPTDAPGLDLHQTLPSWARPWAESWEALGEARRRLNVSQRVLAERTGISRGYLHDLETGRRQRLREGAFGQLAAQSLRRAAEALAAVAIERGWPGATEGAYPPPGEAEP